MPDAEISYDELVAREEDMCRADRVWLAERHAVIKNVSGELQLLSPLRRAQRKTLAVIEWLRSSGKPVRIIIGKSRKQGESTVIELDMYAETIYRGIDSLVIAHQKDLSETIFGITRRYHDYWNKPFRKDIPPIWRPNLYKGVANKGEMRFEDHEGHIQIETAKNVYAGTGMTPQYIHATETSKWDRGAEVAISLNQAIATRTGTTHIIESTFNGFDPLFLPTWEKAYNNAVLTFDVNFQPSLEVTNEEEWNGYVPLFLSCIEDETVWHEFPRKEDRARFIATLDPYEQNLLKTLGATPECLKGRRVILKQQCSGDLDILKQEYPATPTEAVRASGRGRFDNNCLDAMPVEVGIKGRLEFSDRWDKKILWQNDPMSPFIKFKDPVPNHRYVAAVDTSEGKYDDNGKHADSTVMDIYDLDSNMEQVAILASPEISEDAILPYLTVTAEYYNGAFVIIESNSTGKHTCIEMGKCYPRERLYHKDDWNQDKSRMSREIGHRTTFQNKSLVIGSLADAVLSHAIVFHARLSVDELRHYTRKDGGSPEVGYHDDHVTTAGLAVHAAKCYPHRLKSTDTNISRIYQNQPHHDPKQQTRSSVTGY